jgi:hypothetical protein
MLCLLVLPSAYNAAAAFASHNQRIARLSHLYLNCIDRCGKASAQERQNKHGHTHTHTHTRSSTQQIKTTAAATATLLELLAE